VKRSDPIINEIHKVRENLGRRHGFDVRRIAAALRADEGKTGHELVSRTPRRASKKKAS
jgi:hypothetical protein